MRDNCDCACEAPRDIPCRDVNDCCAKKCEATPSATEMVMGHEKAREVSINQKDFGYVVNVGCQTFCIEGLDEVLRLLKEYLNNPGEVEELWRKGKLFISSSKEV